MKFSIEILKFFKVVLAFLKLLFVAGVICFFLIYLYLLALVGGAWILLIVWPAALAFCVYRDRTHKSRSKCCDEGIGQSHEHKTMQMLKPTANTLWRVALAGIGVYSGLFGAITMYVFYDVAHGARSNMEPRSLLVTGVTGLIIAAVCIKLSRFWHML